MKPFEPSGPSAAAAEGACPPGGGRSPASGCEPASGARRLALLGPLRAAALAGAGGLGLLVAGCSSLPGMEPPRVHVVGVERLRGEGLELRLALKLRVQNMGSMPLTFEGLALDLDVNGRRLASGVLAESGTVPRYGETLLTVPVTVSATAAVRQMLGLLESRTDGAAPRELPYVLRGRLSGGPVAAMAVIGAGVSFTSEGSLKLPR